VPLPLPLRSGHQHCRGDHEPGVTVRIAIVGAVQAGREGLDLLLPEWDRATTPPPPEVCGSAVAPADRAGDWLIEGQA
jgi:hypothetical protein